MATSSLAIAEEALEQLTAPSTGMYSEALVMARRKAVQLVGEIEVQDKISEVQKREGERNRERAEEVLDHGQQHVENLGVNPMQVQAELHRAKADLNEAQAYAAFLRVEQARMELAYLLQQQGR
tara:strand:- start:132 stop:503 length:372 start_codon:yes stop_codon:yes gene_type:complete